MTQPISVQFARVRPVEDADIPCPRPMTAGAAGLDLPAAVPVAVQLEPGAFTRIPTGFSMALPAHHEAQVRPRSGLAAKHGVTLLNSPGTIDSDYRGEVQVIVINHGTKPFTIERGMRIAQLVVAPVSPVSVEEVSQLDTTERGDGGFGSTGSQTDTQRR